MCKSTRCSVFIYTKEYVCLYNTEYVLFCQSPISKPYSLLAPVRYVYR